MWKKKVFSVPNPVLLQRLGLCSPKASSGSLQTASNQDEKSRDKKKCIATLLPDQGSGLNNDCLMSAKRVHSSQKEALVKIEEILGNSRETGSSKTPNVTLKSFCIKIAAISTLVGCKKILSDRDGSFSKSVRLHNILPGFFRLYKIFFPSPTPGRMLAVLPPAAAVPGTSQRQKQKSEPLEVDAESSFSLSSSFDSALATCAAWTQNSLGVNLVTLKQHNKAVTLFKKASSSGLSSAQFNLGLCYEKGHGVPKNIEKAVHYYSQAAKQKHAGAIYNLAGCYFQGAGGLPQSQDMGMALLEEAAELGLRQAQTYLGLYYADESTGERNLSKSHQFFLQAASQKDVDAQYYLGVCFEKGLGVDRDMEEAFRWYDHAAKAGHVTATFNLGVFYQYGLAGLPKDTEKAIQYFRTAAEAGDQDAKHNLEHLEKSQDITPHEIVMSLMSHLKFPDSNTPGSDVRIPRNASSPGILGSFGQGEELARERSIATKMTDIQTVY